MKKLLFIIACGSLTLLPISVEAQNVEGQIIASQYGQFQLQGTATNSFVFTPSSCQVTAGNRNFAALTQGIPVRVVDPGNHALDETVTAGLVNINACSVQLAVRNTHLPPFYLTSGTAGLQEAINANALAGPANTIIIDAGFYALGGTTGIITSVVGGSTNLGLVDITTTPYTWYAWGGSAYAKVSVGGGGNPGGTNGAIQTNGNGSFAGAVITGLVKGNGTAAPSAAVAGTDYQAPIANACTGNISCPLTGSTYNFSVSGGAGSGVVGTGTQFQDATYPNAGSTTSVGALTNRYTVPPGLSSAQLNTFFSALSLSTATIQNGDGTTPFANPNFDGVQDLRETFPVKPWNVKESGAQCDLEGGFGSVTSGSPTLTITSGLSLSSADVGKNIEMVSQVAGEPTRFDATITAVTNSTTATLSTNAPFTVSEFSLEVGHRDDAAINLAFGEFTFQRPIEFPVGNCWSDTILVYGQSIHGLSSTRSMITGLAGDDVFATFDPALPGYQAQSPDMQIYDMHVELDPRINASQPWQDVNPSGTVTQHAASYRPTGLFTVWANNPLGPGWIQGPGPNNNGAINGVAITTQNSAVICIPTSETEPATGDKIIFPYFSTIFTSTVSSLSGSGCPGGTNPLTMAAAFPNTSGFTTTQSEWMAGTSVQTIQTAIPSSLTFGPGTLSITGTQKTGSVATYSWTLVSGTAPVVGSSAVISGTTNGSGIFNGSNTVLTVTGTTSGTFTMSGFTTGTVAFQAESGTAQVQAPKFTLTLANPITPPLTPTQADTGSNVAPYGLVQIDGEQFSYFGNSDYPAAVNSTPSITLTGRAQNGTAAVAHSIGATIVPLNPFQPTFPWPVTPSLNTLTMPANATYFPAWDIGNACWAEPWSDGTSAAVQGALSFARFHDITCDATLSFISGNGGGVEGGPNAFQASNATAGMYITRLPFGSHFYNLHFIDPQFGIEEGEPSINAFGVFNGFPTANGSTWSNITIQSAGYDTLFIGGQNDSKRDFVTFCQNGGETGTSNPGQALGVVGCGAAWAWGGTYDDKDGGGGSDNSTATLDNWYIEAENGSQTERQPYYEFNCGLCNYNNIQPSGAVIFVEGGNNNFTGSRFNADSQFPIVNYGANTIMQFIQGVSNSGNSNVYGLGSFLGYAPNASIMGQNNSQSGPYGSLAAGNTIAPVLGQTGDVFATGNDAAAFISNSSAIIYPDQISQTGWTFDDTAPISHSQTTCDVGAGTGCSIFEFDGDGRIPIGKDQLIALGQYVVHYAFKTPQGGTTFNFILKAVDTGSGTCTDASVVFNINVTTTGTGWQQFQSGPGDFSTSQGCDLQMILQGAPSTVPVEMAYMAFSPVWTNVTLPVNTPADNATCTPGAFLGSDSSFLYVCTASGTVKRAPLSSY
jgi:hypothetical protein